MRAQARHWGLFNVLDLPLWIELVAAVLILDLAIYLRRVHHPTDPRETNSNFGLSVPWWDRLFGTCVAEPARGHEDMAIGIEQFRTRDLWLDLMLIQPVRGPATGHAMDQRAWPCSS